MGIANSNSEKGKFWVLMKFCRVMNLDAGLFSDWQGHVYST